VHLEHLECEAEGHLSEHDAEAHEPHAAAREGDVRDAMAAKEERRHPGRSLPLALLSH